MAPEARLFLVPMTLKEAFAFVAVHHRHHRPPQGGLFAIGAASASGGPWGAIHGVAIVGRPVARMINSDFTAEVTRLCSDGERNVCSMLYGAAWRACRAMGYRKLITYTLPEEGGVSLRASGATLIGEAGGGSWARKRRPRVDTHPTQAKLRWEWLA